MIDTERTNDLLRLFSDNNIAPPLRLCFATCFVTGESINPSAVRRLVTKRSWLRTLREWSVIAMRLPFQWRFCLRIPSSVFSYSLLYDNVSNSINSGVFTPSLADRTWIRCRMRKSSNNKSSSSNNNQMPLLIILLLRATESSLKSSKSFAILHLLRAPEPRIWKCWHHHPPPKTQHHRLHHRTQTPTRQKHHQQRHSHYHLLRRLWSVSMVEPTIMLL